MFLHRLLFYYSLKMMTMEVTILMTFRYSAAIAASFAVAVLVAVVAKAAVLVVAAGSVWSWWCWCWRSWSYKNWCDWQYNHLADPYYYTTGTGTFGLLRRLFSSLPQSEYHYDRADGPALWAPASGAANGRCRRTFGDAGVCTCALKAA